MGYCFVRIGLLLVLYADICRAAPVQKLAVHWPSLQYRFRGPCVGQIQSPVAGFGIQTVMPEFNIVVGADRLAKYRPRCRSPTAVNPVTADVLQMLLHTSVASCSCHLFKITDLIANDICRQETIGWSVCVLRQMRPVDDVVFGVRRLSELPEVAAVRRAALAECVRSRCVAEMP